jgi:hypothetical protein
VSLIRIRARASHTRLRAPVVWIRHLGLDSSDVFLASYPRSGNTLLRFPLAEIISGTHCSFENVQRLIPEIGVHGNAYPLLPNAGRLIKTHESYRRKYRRAIYIVRDVRDVLLSAFAREAAMNIVDHDALDSYIMPFMQGKMSRWGAWQDHVERWLHSPLGGNGNLLIMRFEDVTSNVDRAIGRALNFLSMRADPEAIRKACQNNSIEQMRKKEDQSATLPKSRLYEGRLVSSGAVNGWHGKLNARQLEIVEKYAGKTLASLGYPTAVMNSKISPNCERQVLGLPRS